jgi:DNA-binding transcriptional ArsR family regulator
MTLESDQTTLVFRALADSTRRAILHRIAGRPLHVAQLSDHFPISRPAISKHLNVLKEAGLVSFKEQGKKRIYKVEAAPLRLADEWLEYYRKFWSTSLRNLKAHVENQKRLKK